MKKRVIVIHGWDGNPNKDWVPWIKQKLEQKGYDVIAPSMPDTKTPRIRPWIHKLDKVIENPRKNDILIGHSIGCQTILRFLEETQGKVDKVIMVAPWLTLTNLSSKEAWKIADPWINKPINFSKVRNKANTFIAIFSDNDQWVPIKENVQMFKERLSPRIITLHNKSHFSEDEGVKELPEILNVI